MRSNVTTGLPGVLAVALLLCSASCGRQDPDQAYVPGLGEIMTLTQMRHAKLWWAGLAGNWPLASYELDELEEGFQDAMEFHPTHKTSPVRLTEIIPRLTDVPIEAVRGAIERRHVEEFKTAFDALTTGCNACHEATAFGFNVVTRPSANTFLNQDFSAPSKSR